MTVLPTDNLFSESFQLASHLHLNSLQPIRILMMRLPFTLLATLPLLVLTSPVDVLESRQAATCGVCNPNPGQNVCSIITACSVVGMKIYCACRAGYRATTGARPGDTSVQWRLPTPGQEGRVFVSPGVTCDTLCDQWQLGRQGCQEVGLRTDCA